MWTLIFDYLSVDSLFGTTASLSAKYIGLLAFSACFSTAPEDVIPELITPNLLRTLVNHLSKTDRTLNGIARKTAQTISSVAQLKPQTAFPILMRLLSPPHGNFTFDALTKTKTVDGVVAALDNEKGVKTYGDWLMRVIIEATQEANASESDGMEYDEKDEEHSER